MSFKAMCPLLGGSRGPKISHIPFCSSHAVTTDLDIIEIAKAAEYFCSDGVIVTGASTGLAADPGDVDHVHGAINIPLIVGSGVTADNISLYFGRVDAMIVGSEFKVNGKWYNDIDARRIKKLIIRKAELERHKE